MSDADTAITELYAAHWRELVRLGVLLLRDQPAAEDVVQDAFVALHGRWDSLRDPGAALGYLRRAVVNGARSAQRRSAVAERFLRAQQPPGAAPHADRHALAQADRDVVLAALQQLARRQREVLVLRYYLDLSEAEIAEVLGVGRGSVKSHASRGSAALRELLRGVER